MARGLVRAAFVDTPWGYVACGLSLLGVLKEVLVARRTGLRRERSRARR